MTDTPTLPPPSPLYLSTVQADWRVLDAAVQAHAAAYPTDAALLNPLRAAAAALDALADAIGSRIARRKALTPPRSFHYSRTYNPAGGYWVQHVPSPFEDDTTRLYPAPGGWLIYGDPTATVYKTRAAAACAAYLAPALRAIDAERTPF